MLEISLPKSNSTISAMGLGSMYFGTRISEQEAYDLMDLYYASGGRFIDTANNYAFWMEGGRAGISEEVVGRWLAARNCRNDMVISTKVGANPTTLDTECWHSALEGLSSVAIKKAIDESLKRLSTDYIDIYFLHVDQRKTPLEETMEAMASLVESGKVKHIACSNMAAWRIQKAQGICAANDWPSLIGVQSWYSYLQPRYGANLNDGVQRFMDDEIFDYTSDHPGFLLFPYTSTLGGLYSWDTIYDRCHPALYDNFFSEDNERRLKVIKEIASNMQVSVYELLFAWMRTKAETMIPILGVSSKKQLRTNLNALNLNLPEDIIDSLNGASFNGKEYIDSEPFSLKR